MTSAQLGTRLRHLLELLDGDVARVYADLGLPGFRPRFTPVVRTLAERGPLPIRALAEALGVTHSAASQTVTQMRKLDFAELHPGTDARERIVHLTAKTRELLPVLDAEWTATEAALAEFEAELPGSLSELVAAATRALEARPFHERVSARLRTT
ncbi:MarR family winged helix-turn-helix transcriptional regulator [Amycolatopsis albispora]|uniref:MarR family transcriptional regulator n=1 Tax=Amycolatopsis albispora TaxID=1804986 RepID=A0A344LA69_9PSEU|nr:MarR family transcriptional regulator [Amycolatopsis albispora]AXB44943.1 MarR family transcriptional regulator [Amycolatopsis albispora]